ncbi:DUF4190 domain-containing protein [Cellulomonas sp. NPDC089187]|uniref:DUF4190 domain-containing protein n=1 Tax=Cellulomonas sp. NPDC089187 TaxID=3154970 RepID=UPI003417D0BB
MAGPGYADTGATYGGMPPTGASGYQPVGAPYPPPHSHTTDGVSIAALVTGIIGTGPVALVLGIIGLRRTGAGRRGGRGFAIAGTVLGAVGILGWIVVGLFALFVWNTAHSVMDNYRTECADGDLYSCDSLYLMSGAGSDNEHFGNTCGERADSNQYGSCYRYDIDENGQLVDPWDTDDASTEADAYGDDPELDALWGACDAGDGDACNDLYFDSPVGSEYEEFGDTCGGRQEGGGWCS